MKVLHVETGMQIYGGARQVLYLLEGLQARGVDNLLVTPRGAAIAEAARALGVPVRELPMRGDLDIAFVWRLRQLLRQAQPDLLHLHSRRGADLWGGLAGRWAGVPVVLSRRVDNPEPRWWVACKYRLYSRVVTISQGIAEVLKREGVPVEQISVVPSAVDTRRFHPGATALPAELGLALPQGAPVAAMVAQFIARKGHELLLEALERLPEHCARLQVLLFGQGPLREQIAQQISERGLQQRVHLLGFHPALERILPAVDFLIHPALMEGLGVSLLEAGAAGTPAIASRAGGMPEMVIDGETGLLIEPGDVDGLAVAITRLTESNNLRQRLGRRAREWVEERFSLTAMIDGNFKVYQEIMSGLKGG